MRRRIQELCDWWKSLDDRPTDIYDCEHAFETYNELLDEIRRLDAIESAAEQVIRGVVRRELQSEGYACAVLCVYREDVEALRKALIQ